MLGSCVARLPAAAGGGPARGWAVEGARRGRSSAQGPGAPDRDLTRHSLSGPGTRATSARSHRGGGGARRDRSRTMESRLCPGLFLCGEILVRRPDRRAQLLVGLVYRARRGRGAASR